jgi:hypothetical protein
MYGRAPAFHDMTDTQLHLTHRVVVTRSRHRHDA